MTVKFFEKLSNNYLELLNDENGFDVVINVGESPNSKSFKAHSNILRCRSCYFNNILAKTSKNEKHIKSINLNYISIQQFEIIIKYIYGSVVSLENLDASFIFELTLNSYKLIFKELAKHLETYLIETEARWLRLNFVKIYQKSFKNNKLQELQNWCNNIVEKHPSKIFNSKDFTSLQENGLISLISRDDLQIEEIKLWNYVIKWGIAQNPNLQADPENWSQENFLTLKSTLQNCLPLIRYFQISCNDIIDNVQPYQQILEKNLWKDILKRITDPNRPISSKILPPRANSKQLGIRPPLPLPPREFLLTKQFSTVINHEHAAEIASWIDSKTYSTMNNPYKFKLLIRGSKDGFTADSFWNLCGNQENIVIVMKVNGTNEILGGYNPIGWNKPQGSYKHKKDSEGCFIFSLKTDNIQKSNFKRLTFPTSIISNSSYGPYIDGGFIMGNSVKNGNILLQFNQPYGCYWYDNSISKFAPIRNASTHQNLLLKDCNGLLFSVDEYEVFQIRKVFR